MRTTLLFLAMLFLAIPGLVACQAESPADAPVDATPTDAASATPAPTPVEPAPPAGDTSPPPDPASVLGGKVWRAERRSDGGEVGSTYAFLADGTLVVDSPNGTPMTGRWAASGDALSMTEEGITYPTDLVVRDADHVTLRSHNPGGIVEIALVRAPDVPLPTGG